MKKFAYKTVSVTTDEVVEGSSGFPSTAIIESGGKSIDCDFYDLMRALKEAEDNVRKGGK